MKKSLIALAVAGTFAAPAAFAATANVDVGGTMNFSLDYLDADSPTNGGNWNVSSNSSNIYFKGAEDLGGGLKGIWQIQTYFDAGATGNADGSFGATANGVGSGNTYVGLSGGFGTVLLGKHEAPAKLIGRSVDLFGDQIGDNRNLVASSVGSNSGVTTAGFDLRPNNVIAYASPNFSGFTAMLAYVTNTGAGAATDSTVDAWSANVKYDNGPLMVGLGYQLHNLSEAIPGAGDENIWRLAVSYKIGDLRLVGLYQKEDDLNYSGGNNGDRSTWGLGAAYKMGPITLKGQYYNTDDIGNTNNTGADMWALGVDYELSKRTKVQFAYATTDNDNQSRYSAFGGGHGDNPGTVAGGSPSGFSVGVRHSF
ncbi:MAG: porin [Thiobacillaceae bacterium]